MIGFFVRKDGSSHIKPLWIAGMYIRKVMKMRAITLRTRLFIAGIDFDPVCETWCRRENLAAAAAVTLHEKWNRCFDEYRPFFSGTQAELALELFRRNGH